MSYGEQQADAQRRYRARRKHRDAEAKRITERSGAEIPWRTPLAGESERAHEAFLLWVQLPDEQRTYRTAAELVETRPASVANWARRWSWHQRFERYQAEQAPLLSEQLRRNYERAAGIASRSLLSFVEDPGQLENLSGKERAELAKHLTYLHRITAEKATHGVDVRMKLDAVLDSVARHIPTYVPEDRRDAFLAAIETDMAAAGIAFMGRPGGEDGVR